MHDKSYGEILFTIAETKVLTLHLYVRLIADSLQEHSYILANICENAKCVKYCADKYEFFRTLDDEERDANAVEALNTHTARVGKCTRSNH